MSRLLNLLVLVLASLALASAAAAEVLPRLSYDRVGIAIGVGREWAGAGEEYWSAGIYPAYSLGTKLGLVGSIAGLVKTGEVDDGITARRTHARFTLALRWVVKPGPK